MKMLKKFRFAVFAFLFACCISNTAAAASTFEVTDATVTGVADYVRATIQGIDGMTVQHKVLFHYIDDYADLLFTIKNSTPNIRKITGITDNNTNSYVSYTYDDSIDVELNPGDTFDFAVRITCVGLPNEPTELTQLNSVAFTITYDETIIETNNPEEPKGLEGSETTTGNTEEIELVIPNTGLNTKVEGGTNEHKTVIILLALLVGIGFINVAIYILRKKPRAATFLFAISLSATALVAPLTASAEDDFEILNLQSLLGFRYAMYLKLTVIVDETETLETMDTYISLENVLEAHEQLAAEGLEISPRVFGEMMAADIQQNAPYVLDRIEYSNGYDDEPVDMDSMIHDDLYITYYFSSNLPRYNITYELNGGTMPETNPTSYTAMSQVEIEEPTREGYVFLGWTIPDMEMEPESYINFEGRDVLEAGFTDLHFVAHWREAYRSNIYYNLDGGTVSEPNPDIYYEGQPYFTLNAPTREDWVFTGWTLSDDAVPDKNLRLGDLREDITVTAHWKKVYIYYRTDSYWPDASPDVPREPIEMKTAEEYIAPQAYWKDVDSDSWMIHFVGWQEGGYWMTCNTDHGLIMYCENRGFRPGDVIKAAGYLPENDISLHAEYVPVEHPINYTLGEGGYIEGEYQTSYNWFSEFDFPIPTREGYGFVKWDIHGIQDPDEHHRHWTPQLLGIDRGPINITAVWEENPKSLTEIEYLQDATYTNCLVTPVGVTATLKDKRDEKPYRVRRLADNRCWMIDNLALENYTLTSADSDLPDGTTFVLPASSITGFNSYYAVNGGVAVYLDADYGGYYKYNAAVAGTGTPLSAGESSEASICPKGWDLPKGKYRGDGEYKELLNLYIDDRAWLNSDTGPEFKLGGYYNLTQFYYIGTGAHYWTATSDGRNAKNGIAFEIYDNETLHADHSNSENYNGAMVRCYLWD